MNLYRHAKNQVFSSLCSRDIVDLKTDCNLIGWQHFGPYLWNQIFPKIWDLCQNTANNINFHYRPNSEKINDYPVLAHFPIFLVKKFFFKKSGSVKHKKTWALNTMLSFRIKLMSQSRKNFRTEGQTDPNSQNPSDHGRGSNIVRHFLVSRTSALYGLWNPKFTQTYLS